TTTFGSSTSLTAAVTAAQLNTTGTFAITVVNPGVAASNSHDFTVVNPVAVLSSLSQTGATLNATPFTLTVTGTNFIDGAVVHFEIGRASWRDSSCISLMAAVTAAQLNTTGTFAITVVNPGVAASKLHDFTVVNPVAVVSSLSQ